ncbi:MAG TPA: penicillin-insensitive murein endopeptidase [Solirubrobacteraceae bacterium]|nr:penicillin-insensitive murein endopeptidase [Solirubrobacteraceae bacterium]
MVRRPRVLVALVVLAAGCLVASGAAVARLADVPAAEVHSAPEPPSDDGPQEPGGASGASISWRASRATGLPWAGRLERGVQLPPEGGEWFTWDPVLLSSPDRGWRRWGTDALIRMLLNVLREYRAAHPGAARVGVGDLSRRFGGPFGARYGGLGHGSHQNGLDVDVYYPRRDGRERKAFVPEQVDEALAQDLVDRFVAVGAIRIFVGPRLHLRGPGRIVRKLVHHDDHLHVRLPRPPE